MKLKRIFLLLIFSNILLVLFVSCTNKVDYYYIIKHSKDNFQNKKNGLPIIIPIYYGQYNFILLNSSTVFYFQPELLARCGTGLDHSKPPKINLTPEDLKEIKLTDLETFLDNNIKIEKYSVISISSPVDTIRNIACEKLINFLKTKKSKFYGIRNWTEEEKYVVLAKVRNKNYDPKSIKWKVGFDDDHFYHSIGAKLPPIDK